MSDITTEEVTVDGNDYAVTHSTKGEGDFEFFDITFCPLNAHIATINLFNSAKMASMDAYEDDGNFIISTYLPYDTYKDLDAAGLVSHMLINHDNYR